MTKHAIRSYLLDGTGGHLWSKIFIIAIPHAVCIVIWEEHANVPIKTIQPVKPSRASFPSYHLFHATQYVVWRCRIMGGLFLLEVYSPIRTTAILLDYSFMCCCHWKHKRSWQADGTFCYHNRENKASEILVKKILPSILL